VRASIVVVSGLLLLALTSCADTTHPSPEDLCIDKLSAHVSGFDGRVSSSSTTPGGAIDLSGSYSDGAFKCALGQDPDGSVTLYQVIAFDSTGLPTYTYDDGDE
jgi:hypothetical protein